MCFFVFKQKTSYEMRISDWSLDVCSSDLFADCLKRRSLVAAVALQLTYQFSLVVGEQPDIHLLARMIDEKSASIGEVSLPRPHHGEYGFVRDTLRHMRVDRICEIHSLEHRVAVRSEEHKSELQSLMRISYAVLCLKKKHQN